MQHVGDHYNTGNTTAFHSMHFTPAAENTTTTSSGPTTTSVLRSWRKKDASEKQSSTTSSSSSEAASNAIIENQGPVARVAPHNHYPKPVAPPPPADIYRYPQQYGDFGVQNPSQIPAPVKYSEIIEPMQSIEQLAPVLQKPKEKSYLDMCNVGQNHMKAYPDYQNYKQHYDGLKNYNHMPGYKQQYHPYLQKESQMSGYVQKETNLPPQYLHNYKMSPPNYARNYQRESNEFLANLNKIAPDMAQDIINDPHLRDPHLREPQFSMYPAIDQNRLYQQQHQRMYQRSSPIQHPVQNYGQRNMAQNFNQYQMNQQRMPPDPYRMYPHQRYGQVEQITPNISPRQYHENIMGFPPRMSPNYPPCGQLEYAQHYQHRQVPMRQDFLPIPNKPFIEAHPEIPEIVPDESIHQSKKTLKAYLENWREEFTEEADTSETTTNDKIQLVKTSVPNRENTLYVLDAMEIPSENIPQYLHLQSIDKLPPNIRAFAYNAEETAMRQNAIVIANVKNEEINKNEETTETKTKDNTYRSFHNKDERNVENAIYNPNMNLNSYKSEEITIEDDRPACKLLQSMANARNANDRPGESQNPDRDKILRPCFVEPRKEVCRSLPQLISAEPEEIDKNRHLESAYSEIVDSILEESTQSMKESPSGEDNVAKMDERKGDVSNEDKNALASIDFHENELMNSLKMIERKSVIAQNTLPQHLSNSKDAEDFSEYASFEEKKDTTDELSDHLSDASKHENLLKYTMDFEEKDTENIAETFKEKAEEFHDEERTITKITNEHPTEEDGSDEDSNSSKFKDLPALENPIDLSHHFEDIRSFKNEERLPSESNPKNNQEESIKDDEENKHVYTDILMFKDDLNLAKRDDNRFEEHDVKESNKEAKLCFNVEDENQKNIMEEEKNVIEKEKNVMEEEMNVMEEKRNIVEEENVIEEEKNIIEENTEEIKQHSEEQQVREINENDFDQSVENGNSQKPNVENSNEGDKDEIQLPSDPDHQEFEEHDTEFLEEASERENDEEASETNNTERKIENGHKKSTVLPEVGSRSIDDFEKDESSHVTIEEIAEKSVSEESSEKELLKKIKVECDYAGYEEGKCEEMQKEHVVELSIPDVKEDYDDDCVNLFEELNEETDSSDEESDISRHDDETNATPKEDGDNGSKSFTFLAETTTEMSSSCENEETVFGECVVAEKLEDEIEKSFAVEGNLKDESPEENSEGKESDKTLESDVSESNVHQSMEEETSVCEENEPDEHTVTLPVTDDSNLVLCEDNIQETTNSNNFDNPDTKEENNNDIFDESTSGSRKDEDYENELLCGEEATNFSYLQNGNASNGDSIVLKGQNDEEETPKDEIDSSFVIEIAKELLQINVTQDNGQKVISITPLTKVKVVTRAETIEKNFGKESEEIQEETRTELTEDDRNVEDSFEIEDTNEITNVTDDAREEQDILCTDDGVEEIEEISTDPIQMTEAEHFEEVPEIVDETEILLETCDEVVAASVDEDQGDNAEEIVENELITEAELYLHNEVIIENKDINDAEDEIQTIKEEEKEIFEEGKEEKGINNNYIQRILTLESKETACDEEVEKERPKTDRLRKKLLKLKRLKDNRCVNGKKSQLNPLRSFRKAKMKKNPNPNPERHILARDKRKTLANFDSISIGEVRPLDSAEKTKIFSSVVVIDKISPESIKKITKTKHNELTSKKSSKKRFGEHRLLNKHYSMMQRRQKEMARNIKKKKNWKRPDRNVERDIAVDGGQMPSSEANKDDDEDLSTMPNENIENKGIFLKIDDVSSNKTMDIDVTSSQENSEINDIKTDDTNAIPENCDEPETMDQSISDEKPVLNDKNPAELEEKAKDASTIYNPDATMSETGNKFLQNSSTINLEASNDQNPQPPEMLPTDSKPTQLDKNLPENRIPETTNFLIPEAVPKSPSRNDIQGGKIFEKYPRDLRRTKSANHFDQNIFHFKKRRLSLEEYNNRKKMLIKSSEPRNAKKQDVFPTVNADKEKEKMVQEVLQSLKSEDVDFEEYGKDGSREKSILKVVATCVGDRKDAGKIVEKIHVEKGDEDVGRKEKSNANVAKVDNVAKIVHPTIFFEKNVKDAFPKAPIEEDVSEGNFGETNATKTEEKSNPILGGSVVEKNITPMEKPSKYATYLIPDDDGSFPKAPATKNDEKHFDKFTIEEKLNSLHEYLPKIAPKDPTQIEISRKLEELLKENPISYTQKYSEVLLIKRFLKHEDLTPEELKKIRQIVQCKRAFESIKSSTTVDVTKRRHSSDFPKSIKIDFNDFDLKRTETEVVKDDQNRNRRMCYNRSISAFVEAQLKKTFDGEARKRCNSVKIEDYARTDVNRSGEKEVETSQKIRRDSDSSTSSRFSVITEHASKEKVPFKNKISKDVVENDKGTQAGKILENSRKDKEVIIPRSEKIDIFKNGEVGKQEIGVKKDSGRTEEEEKSDNVPARMEAKVNNNKVNEESKKEKEAGDTKEGFSNTKTLGAKSGEIPKEEIHKITPQPKPFKHSIQNLIANANPKQYPEQYCNTKLPGDPSWVKNTKCVYSEEKSKRTGGLESLPSTVETRTGKLDEIVENKKTLTSEKHRWRLNFGSCNMTSVDRQKNVKYSSKEAIYSKSKDTIVGLDNIPGLLSKKNSKQQMDFERKTSDEDHISQNKLVGIPKKNFVKSTNVEKFAAGFPTNSPTKVKQTAENPIFQECFKRKPEIERGGVAKIYKLTEKNRDVDFKAEIVIDNQNANKRYSKSSKVTEKIHKETALENSKDSETRECDKIEVKDIAEKETSSCRHAKKVFVEKNFNREKLKNLSPLLRPKIKSERDNALKVYTKDSVPSASGSKQSTERKNYQEACLSVLSKPISKTKAQLKSFQDQVENKPTGLNNKDQINSNISPVISNITKLTALLSYYKRGIETGVDSANLKKIEEIMNQLSPNLKNLPNLPEAAVPNEYEVSKPENDKLKLHLKKVQGENRKRKKRFRNLYTENESDEDPLPKAKEAKVEKYDGDGENLIDYSVYQRKCPVGVPKLVIKRRKSDFKLNVQPYVKINRIASIESMVRKRKRWILASQVFVDN